MAESTARDRRARLVIYVLLVVLVAVGLVFPSLIKDTPAPEAIEAYQLVETVPAGGCVFLGVDSLAAGGDGQRQLTALVRHVLSSGAMLMAASTDDAGAAELDRVIRAQLNALRRRYGEDAVNLGSRPGGTGYLEALAGGFASAAQGRDHRGEDLELLPLAHSFRRLDDARLFLFITGGPAAAARSGQNIAFNNGVKVLLAVSGEDASGTAVQLWQEGRVNAILVGGRATSDYDSLVAGGGSPSRYLTALTFGTLFVIALIVWAYLSGLITRRRRA